MDFVTVGTWIALAILPAFLLLDLVWRARKFDTPRGWRVRAFAITLLAFALSFVIPALWASVFGDRSLLKLSSLGTVGGAVTGILVYQFFHYWYHRTIHRNDTLWRWFHQMHHSAESLDAWGAYFLAPSDVFMFVSITTLVVGPGLGVSVEAAILINIFLTFNAVFQHANVRTPRWLGYVIQRPESHAIHHERGVHAYNYADLPLMDMLFGTFRNPATWDGELGFWKGASARIGAMLMGRDVSVDPSAAKTVEQKAA